MEPAAPAAQPGAAPAIAAQPDPNATAAPGGEQKPEVQPERTFTQKELDDILEKRLAKERRKREELSRRLAVTEELALRGRPKEEPAKSASEAEGEDPEPQRDKFDDYESYMRALGRWEGRQAAREERKKEREAQEKRRTVEEQQKLERSFRERAAVVAKEVEDFEEVMESSEAPMTKHMADAMLTSDIGPRIAYHLAKNPGEAERIASLPAARQAAEIGKLEAKLSGEKPAAEPEPTPTPKDTKPKPSGAPEPIAPVGGSKGKVTTEEPTDKDSSEEWLRKRNAQLRRKK